MTTEELAIRDAIIEAAKTDWNYEPDVFRERFASPWEQYRHRLGQRFTVLEKLPLIDDDPPIQLYRIRFEDGFVIEAWPEEICVATDMTAAEIAPYL